MLASRNRETPNTAIMGVLLDRIAQERVSAGLVPFFFFVLPPKLLRQTSSSKVEPASGAMLGEKED